MESDDQVHSVLSAAISATGSQFSAADRLCRACVEVLDVDGAAVSLIDHGETRGTFGSSGALSKQIDEFQFTFGEGPCLDAVRRGVPVLVEDLTDLREVRWPAFTGKMLENGIRAVFALPVHVASVPVAALDLFRLNPGPLSSHALRAGLWAADLAAVPVLDLMTAAKAWNDASSDDDGFPGLGSSDRVEVYQATGMLIVQLNVEPAEALVRLRAYAFAHGATASEVAWAIVERRLWFDDDGEAHGSHSNAEGSPP